MHFLNIKKGLVALSFFIGGTFLCPSQVSVDALSLDYGTYAVGFKHYMGIDSTRTYKRYMDFTSENIFREIPISIWYPAANTADTGTTMTVLDYMQILKEEEEWEHLPNAFILNWFYYPNTEENQKHLKEAVQARWGATAKEGTFPLVIYAPSNKASSIENFALCEYLASHGIIVISSPSRGPETRPFEGGVKDMEAQARDLEFLVKESLKNKSVDQNAIATMGFSSGGLSNVLAQIRNKKIRANVSLDGSIKYQYATLQKSPLYAANKITVPFIHMAQKKIPEQVMKEDKIDASLNDEFKFYDELTQSEAYSLQFNNMTHSYFSTLGILFEPRDPRQDKTDAEIMESYKWISVYTLNFLKAYLIDIKEAMDFIGRAPEKNGVPPGIISLQSKKPIERVPSFEEFHEMAIGNSYSDLMQLYASIKKNKPEFALEQWKLNQLGLQLVFDSKKSKAGIAILELAVGLYPESANLFDSLAEAYLYIGDNKKAIKNFERSLEHNPANQNAVHRLKELKG